MAHGKFNGGVMTVDHGKTYHATFADGHKKGRWTAGPLISKAEPVETASAEKPEAAAPVASALVATEQSSEEKASQEKAERRAGEETAADIPAEGPEESEVSGQKSEISEPAATKSEKPAAAEKASPPLIAQASAEEPDQSSTPRTPGGATPHRHDDGHPDIRGADRGPGPVGNRVLHRRGRVRRRTQALVRALVAPAGRDHRAASP